MPYGVNHFKPIYKHKIINDNLFVDNYCLTDISDFSNFTVGKNNLLTNLVLLMGLNHFTVIITPNFIIHILKFIKLLIF